MNFLKKFWEYDWINKLFAVFLIFGAVLFFFIEKGDMVLAINRFATDGQDKFFKIYTDLGLGIVWVFVCIVFLFIGFYRAILSLFILAFNGIFTFLFKQVLFHGMPRPTGYFPVEKFHHFIEGFDYHTANSFPSGHTITAFSIAFFLAYAFRNKALSVLFFIYALTIGISRMYLLQHFFMDIYVGAILGYISTLLGIGVARIFSLHQRLWWKQALVIRQNGIRLTTPSAKRR